MRFTGKVIAPLEDIAHDVNESAAQIAEDVNMSLAQLNVRMEKTTQEASAMFGLGIIAFALVSVVAVSALLIATKRSM